VAQKTGTFFVRLNFIRLNFIKYWPIFKLFSLSHPAVFTSNVQCVRLAAGRRTLKMCCYRSSLVFSCWFKSFTFHRVV